VANNNRWFKHYNIASQGNSLRLLWDSGDYETYGAWWRLLELVSLWESDDARGRVTISLPLLRREWGWNAQKLVRVLGKIGGNFGVKFVPKEFDRTYVGTIEVLIPKWLELQETRGGKRNAKKDQKPDRSKKREVRSKKRDTEPPLHASACPPDPTAKIHTLAEIWNAHRGKLPECKSTESSTRRKACETRWRSNPDPKFWEQVVKRIAASNFCGGSSNTSWIATFDWLIRPDTATKVLEGKYDNRHHTGRQLGAFERDGDLDAEIESLFQQEAR
jgi:hypothetical protein